MFSYVLIKQYINQIILRENEKKQARKSELNWEIRVKKFNNENTMETAHSCDKIWYGCHFCVAIWFNNRFKISLVFVPVKWNIFSN